MKCCHQFQNKNDISVYQKRSQVFVFADHIFSAMTDTEHSQGILAVCQKKENTEFHFNSNGFYLLIEEMQDPGNLGTIIRTADACHVDAVFLSKGCVDLYNPKVLRSTMGSLFHVPIFRNVDFISCISKMKQQDIFVLGNLPHYVFDPLLELPAVFRTCNHTG